MITAISVCGFIAICFLVAYVVIGALKGFSNGLAKPLLSGFAVFGILAAVLGFIHAVL